MYKNILVPVLLDKEHDTQATYDIARALADVGAKFTVLHVIEAIPAFIQSQIPTEILARTHQELEEHLVEVARALAGAVPKLATGHAGNYIVDYAAEHDIDCIVIASHRPGLGDYLLGSTAARVVRHAKCSVHVAR